MYVAFFSVNKNVALNNSSDFCPLCIVPRLGGLLVDSKYVDLTAEHPTYLETAGKYPLLEAPSPINLRAY